MPLAIGELAQNFGRVVADPDQADAATVELSLDLLQLNELRFAVGSPSRTSVKDHQGTPPATPAMQPDQISVGVGKLEVRKRFANGRPNPGVVRLGHERATWISHRLFQLIFPRRR